MRSKNNNHSSAAPARHTPPAAAPPRAAPPPAAPHPPATQQHNNHSAHPAPHQQAPPTVVQQGPGFMGTLAATAAGSVAGNAIGNMLFGGRSHEGVQESGAGAVASAPTAVNPCAPHINQFIQCVESSANDVTACQWSWNNVAECRRSFPQLF